MANWTTTIGHGIGSQLHVMAMLFSVALAANRVFVPYPHSFQRANVSSCQGRSHLSLDCYFAPLLPRECMFKAMKYFNSKDKKAKKIVWIADRLHLATVLNAEEPLIYLHHYPWKLFLSLHDFPKAMEWPKYKVPSPLNKVMIKNGGKMPWLYANSYMEIEKKDFHLSDAAKMKMWMLSQVVRYMLRWPSLHLCHAMNIERHNVYGRHVIDRVVRTSHMQSNADVDDKLRGFGGFEAKHWVRSEPQFLRNIMDEPYMPRPIVSVHVRQGDKAIEMKLFSFSSHMYFVHKLRYHEPNLKYVWLSTEMQSVVEESKAYSTWSFLYSDLPRQHGEEKMHDYENMVGRSRFVDLSFVNLMIASECDYFVGTLGSNWNILINELRLTNGRAKSKYLTLNIFEEMFGI